MSGLGQSRIIAYVVLLSLLVLILVPFQIWCLLQIKQNWDEPYMKKRRRVLVLSLVSALCVFSFLLVPNQVIYDIYFSEREDGQYFCFTVDSNIYCYIASIICWIILFPTGIFSSSLFPIRVWLLYYDLQLSRFAQNKEWQMAINPTIESSNWFVNPKNQRRFGQNGTKLIQLTILLTIVELFLYIAILVWVDAEYVLAMFVINVISVSGKVELSINILFILYKIKGAIPKR